MIKPTRGYCLIEPDKAEEKTTGGLFVPETAQEKPQKGTVIAFGNETYQEMELLATGKKLEGLVREFKEGTKVYYKKWAGDEIIEGGKTLKFVKFEDILGVIDG